ncbi:MAG: hypothetical protein IPK99_02320 [Flavobacteriales bacterium]|nr:hypothetical protein [Flavobacteriales bacterium]
MLSREHNVGIHLTQLSPAGDMEWSRSYVAANTALNGMDLGILPNGAGYVIAGTAAVFGLDKPFLLMTDTAGLTYSRDGPLVNTVAQMVNVTPTTWTNGTPDPGSILSPIVYAQDPAAVEVLVCGSIVTELLNMARSVQNSRVSPNPFSPARMSTSTVEPAAEPY